MEEGQTEKEAAARATQGRGEGRSNVTEDALDRPPGTSFEVLGLDHVDVTAPVELQSEVLAWYRDCLGLDEIQRPPGVRPEGGWFRAGNQEIHISIDEHNPPKVAHFAIVVDNFDVAVERLRGAGYHIEQASSIPGRHRLYTRDPAGNRIEIMSFDEPWALVAVEERAADPIAPVIVEERADS